MVGWADGGTVHSSFMLSMLGLVDLERANPSDTYALGEVIHETGLYVQENRNNLVRRFLASGSEWLLQLDGDESFRPELLRILMRTAADHRIVTGIYSNVAMVNADGADGGVQIVNCIYGMTENGDYVSLEPPETMLPFEIDAAGTGIMLVHRDVFEALTDPWFWVEMFEQPDGSRQFMNEDIAFCRSARVEGFEIWCDPLAEVIHWKTLPLMPSTVRTYLREAEHVFDEMSATNGNRAARRGKEKQQQRQR